MLRAILLFAASVLSLNVAVAQNATIEIVSAKYYSGDKSCDAKSLVQNQCEGHTKCQFIVGSNMCGDPAPHEMKKLNVSYRCGNITKNVDQMCCAPLYLHCP